ncbi:class I SAM-dependent methyltransferase [Sporolactobacillus sp. THM7-4]|nr:class I SAM-dependent methyltransferase [Sporolactobacillus sp. THM7-4]
MRTLNRIESIRQQEKAYHDAFYGKHQLFEADTWLEKPAQTVMDCLALLGTKKPLDVLDLGSGIGRNSIPIARSISKQGGRVVCVDLLESAISRLTEYGRVYGVQNILEIVKSDIGKYRIPPRRFDLILAVSSLEHIATENDFDRTIMQMVRGTRSGGINALIVNTSIQELDQASGLTRDPMVELNFSSARLIEKLNGFYAGWKILNLSSKRLSFPIDRNGRNVNFQTEALTYAVQKKGSGD